MVTGPDGHVYAWWWSTDLRVLWRRTDLVPRAPRTWDELIAAAEAAEKKDPKVDGYLFNGGRWEATTFDNLGYFWAQGGRLLDGDGAPVFAEGRNREAMLRVLQFLRRAITTGVSPSRVTTFNTYDRVLHRRAGAVRGDVPRRLVPVVDDAVAAAQGGVRALGGVRAAGAATGDDRHGDRRLVHGGVQRGPEEDRGVHGHREVDLRRPGQHADGRAADVDAAVRLAGGVPAPIYRTVRRFLRHGEPRPGLSIYPSLSNEIQIAVGRVLTGGATPEEALQFAGERVAQTYELLSGT